MSSKKSSSHVQDATMYCEKSRSRANIEANASFISRVFFVFVWPLLWRGFKKELQEEDLCELLKEHASEEATASLCLEWERERRRARAARRKPSFGAAMIRFCGLTLAAAGLLVLVEELSLVVQPLAMGLMIRYFRFDSPLSFREGLMAAAAMSFTSAAMVLVHHPYFFVLRKLGMRMRVASCGLVMRKGVRLSNGALRRTTVGHMVTLMSSDVQKFNGCLTYIHYLWLGPLLLIFYAFLLWNQIGVCCLPGFGVLLLLTGFQYISSQKIGYYRGEVVKRTDKRVSVMSEVLNGIRTIKMYAWEDAFADAIRQLRRAELSMVRLKLLWQAVQWGIFWVINKAAFLFSMICYLLLESEISAERIFVVASLFGSVRWSVSYCAPEAYRHWLEARVTVARIQAFLELDEFVEVDETTPLNTNEKIFTNGFLNDFSKAEKIPLAMNGLSNGELKQHTESNAEPIVEVENLSCVWDSADEESAPIAISDVTFTAVPGQLVALVGPVGCGKSAVLCSILRETHRVSGSLRVRGRLAYVSQDSWIFAGTLRENVLFGEPYDEQRYMQVIHDCTLDKDIARMRKSDLTLVGDRGQALSGGQKARIGLARALYRDADVYLLDDPLSAVDAAVGRFLFDRCISEVLKPKVTILVTHQVQYLKDADQILLMRNGRIVASGTMDRLTQLSTFSEILKETENSYIRQRSKCDDVLDGDSGNDSQWEATNSSDGETERISTEKGEQRSPMSAKRLSTISRRERMSRDQQPLVDGDSQEKNEVEISEEEDRNTGAVSWRVYLMYLRSLGWSRSAVPGCMVFAFVVQIVNNFSDWWLTKWANAVESAARDFSLVAANSTANLSDTSNVLLRSAFVDRIAIGTFVVAVDLSTYQNVFAAVVLLLMIGSLIRCIWFRLSEVKASHVLHDSMLNAIVSTRVLFFDKNPVGRILNRFSKDVDTVDDDLAFNVIDFSLGSLEFVGLVSVIVALNPVVFAPSAFLFALFLMLRLLYLSTSRVLRRLESTTRSPLYSHISAVMEGLITVRAFSNQSRALALYHNYQDRNTSPAYLSMCAARVFASTIDWIVTAFISGIAYSFFFAPVVQSGEVGLTLMYVVQLTGFFSWLMRESALLQNEMVSVERIVHYAELPVEPVDGVTPPVEWPVAGHLQFRNVSMRYEKTSDFVLANIDADIQPNEKIGIVGRTGAGKSSLLRALFRLVECDGQIVLDGIDTKRVALKELRKRISVIPQDPVLFIGTLRQNLDPFGEFQDDKLWAALEQVQLKATVCEQPLALEMHMQEGGANFSVGQRQLICLARAILRHARVLVLDEATANVDPETDSLIQRTIRERFACSTILTVAHRLHTIMDSDRVMVMEKGRIAEFDHPNVLLADAKGLLSKLVDETGDQNSRLLRRLAAVNFSSQEARKRRT